MAWLGSGIYSSPTSAVTIEDCVFYHNYATRAGGALYIGNGSVTGTSVARNEARFGGGIVIAYGNVEIRRSLVFGNCAWESADEILVNLYSDATVECSGYTEAGVQVSPESSVQYVGDQFHNDPLYCDPQDCKGQNWGEPHFTGDYHLSDGSPYLAENNSCGVLIGALGTGCAGPILTGACCCPWGACYVYVEDQCLARMSCTYLGDGTVCDPDPCATAVQRTTWGRIKARFRSQ